jgi:hypothetical protein
VVEVTTLAQVRALEIATDIVDAADRFGRIGDSTGDYELLARAHLAVCAERNRLLNDVEILKNVLAGYLERQPCG